MKFVPSAIGMGSPSGSQGSTTASHNRSGYYLRNRVIPTNPNTTRQQTIRSMFGSMIQSWTMLDAAVRAGWDNYGAQVPVTDKVGQQINLTGQNWYVGNNTARAQALLPGVTNAPTIFDTGEPVVSISPQGTGSLGEIGLDVLASAMSTNLTLEVPASDDGDVLIYLGPPINPSRTFFKGPYQFAGTVAIAAAAANAIWVADPADVPVTIPPEIGQVRPIRLRVAYDDGRLSQPYDIIAPIVDDPV